MSILRAYLINALTGEEMKDHPLNGKTWVATSGAHYEGGEFVHGTASKVTVADWASTRGIKGETFITPDLFDHPVVVKVWAPNMQDWRILIPEETLALTDLDRRRAKRCVERSFYHNPNIRRSA